MFVCFLCDVVVWDYMGMSVHGIMLSGFEDRIFVYGVFVGSCEFVWCLIDFVMLIWVEVFDGGDWKVKVLNCDKVMLIKVLFDKESGVIVIIE